MSRGVWDYAHDCTVAERYDADLAGTPLLHADLEFVIRQLQPSSQVVDLGCGTGRAAIALALAGHTVFGVDYSQPMLSEARRKAAAAKVRLLLARGNIVELPFVRDEAFDAAICLFSTLGMISGAAARSAAIAEARRVIRPGGKLILHVHQLGHHWSTRAGRRLVCRDLFRRLAQRADAGDFPMPAQPTAPAWTMHLFTRGEIVDLLRRCGFVVDELYPVGADGQRHAPAWRAYGLLLAAHRPAV